MSDKYKTTNRCYLIDHHSPQPPVVPLDKIDIAEYQEFIDTSNIDSLMVYCKDHWGVTYYDSSVPGAQKHRGLKSDWIKEVSSCLKNKGIEFVAYYCVEYDEGAARTHPEWRVLTSDGTPLIRNDKYAKWSLLCYQTGYRRYVLDQLKEIVTNYHPDSLFLDIFGASLCYCSSCRDQFKREYGYNLPVGNEELVLHKSDILDSLNNKAENFYREIKATLKVIDPTLAITINFSCHYPKKLRDMLDYQYSEPLMKNNWFSSAYARDTAIGQYPMLAPGEASQVYNYDSANKYICDLSSIAAQGCRVGMYSGSQHIDGTLEHEESHMLGKAYCEIQKMEPWLKQSRRPIKSIGILQSDQSKQVSDSRFYPDAILRMKNKPPHLIAVLGAMMCCESTKIPYNILPEDTISDDLLSQYELIILPEVYILNHTVLSMLRKYAENGGALLISGKTGLYNSQLEEIPHPDISELIGAEVSDVNYDYTQNDWSGYIHADDQHLFSGLLSVTTPPISNFFIETKAICASPLAHFALPCVKCSPTEWINWWSPPPGELTNTPAILLNHFKKGLVLYLAYDFFTMASTGDYRDSNAGFNDFLNILHVTPKIRIETTTTDIINTAFFETANSYQIHQISNLPGLFKGESTPIPGGTLKTKLKIKKAYRVYPEYQELKICELNDVTNIELPSVSLQQLIICEKQ